MPIEQLPVADSLQPTGVRKTPPPPRVAHRATLPSYNIIYFYHPGCNKPFFFVQAYDQDPVLRKWGVHHCIVLDALSILAGNQPGFVSTDLQGLHKVNLESTPILTEQKYYFHVDLPSHLSSSSYRVMESFRAWRPPDGLPHHWADNGADPDIRGQGYAESQMSSTVKTQDKNCIISGYSEAIQNAHLVPAAEKAWFQRHNQTIHNNNPHVISPDDISNGISLRDDIHRLLDDQKFVFTPLEGYIVVFFIEWFPNYASRFHRTAVELPDRISPHHVFSRFAYNIIESSAPLVKGLPNDYIQQVPQELRKPKSSSRAKRRPSEEGASTLEAVSEAPKAVSETRDEPMDGLAENVEGLSAPSVVSSDEDDEVDSEAHSRKVKMWEKAYPKLQVEVEDSDDRNFNYLGWHPELPKMDKLVEDWFKKNPQVRQLSDGSTASHV